jgi:5-methylthioribose kinase
MAGPMGFDTGLMLANLLFAYLAQPGRKNDDQYSAWILHQTILLFDTFEDKFVSLWNNKETACRGDFSHAELLRASPSPSSARSKAAKASYMQDVWSDTLGFAGAELIRRIVGIAHVEDLDGIEDLNIRSQCEKRCLLLARHFMLQATNSSYESSHTHTYSYVLPLVRRPKDLLQVVEALNALDITEVVWP